MEEKTEGKKDLTYVDADGTELWGIKELNLRLKGQTEILKKYYLLAQIALAFIIIITLWMLWQMKKYHVITKLITALAG